ncbi:MAG: tRNA pseudouridine(38-40) synthase TruA [Muribaculaceae bacterium]|nr:tRNA pseudouridine(38-40) synthase TruA [Muribaculaceae bacterium]
MRRFIQLSYNGRGFHGWQRQPGDDSVQQRLEESLATILREPISVTGAGRTDAGVHARKMYAHFDFAGQLPDRSRLIRALNTLVGPAIAIEDIIDVHNDAHARFDAVARVYKYFVMFGKSPFLSEMAWYCPNGLDVNSMNEAAELLLNTADFTSFAKLHSDSKTNICKVVRASWDDWENDFGTPGVVFTIEADRFLRNMVRAVVGTLVEVGRGKLSRDDFAEIIKKRNRCAAGTSMPAHALFLWDVKYPYLN